MVSSTWREGWPGSEGEERGKGRMRSKKHKKEANSLQWINYFGNNRLLKNLRIMLEQ